ncbi:hypothetical protein KW805_01410 [Candidatus Pacearchaeota archaeon]|nr:hypothetical protein [Candidatus Pacearchaeota archaeon]
MPGFDSQKVLEIILQEAPIQTNRRSEIRPPKAPWWKGKKVPIYAYYYNQGIKDPELSYDRIKHPLQTTPHSTLCEVYSFWESHPNVQRLLNRLTKEKEMHGKVLYQGPCLKINDIPIPEDVIVRTRLGEGYHFFLSASHFADHFNWTCEKLSYEPRIIYDSSIVQINKKAIMEIGDEKISIDIVIPEPLKINLLDEDPTLAQAMEAVTRAYRRIKMKLHSQQYTVYRAETVKGEKFYQARVNGSKPL